MLIIVMIARLTLDHIPGGQGALYGNHDVIDCQLRVDVIFQKAGLTSSFFFHHLLQGCTPGKVFSVQDVEPGFSSSMSKCPIMRALLWRSPLTRLGICMYTVYIVYSVAQKPGLVISLKSSPACAHAIPVWRTIGIEGLDWAEMECVMIALIRSTNIQ